MSHNDKKEYALDKIISEVREDTAAFFKVPVLELLGNTRGNNLRCARIAFVKILRDSYELPFSYIASFLDRDHTTAIYFMRQHNFLLKKDKTYKDKFDKLHHKLHKKYGADLSSITEELRRKQRKRADFEDSTKPGDASVNRNDALYSSRVEKKILKAVEEFRAKSGMTKKAITEAALLEYIEKHSPDAE